MLSSDDLLRLRASLEGERDQLRRQIQEMADDEDEVFDENFADSGQVAAEQGEYRTLANTLADQLAEVEHALSKFEAGTYGLCERSGEPIPLPRLEAMPATRFRIEHA